MTSPSATAASASRRVLERRARGSIAWWGGSSSAEKRNLFWSAPNCAQLPSIGAIFCLGPAGPVVFADPRWSSIRLLLQIGMIMVTLMLVWALRPVQVRSPRAVGVASRGADSLPSSLARPTCG
jgi:hypothetical protein